MQRGEELRDGAGSDSLSGPGSRAPHRASPDRVGAHHEPRAPRLRASNWSESASDAAATTDPTSRPRPRHRTERPNDARIGATNPSPSRHAREASPPLGLAAPTDDDQGTS